MLRTLQISVCMSFVFLNLDVAKLSARLVEDICDEKNGCDSISLGLSIKQNTHTLLDFNIEFNFTGTIYTTESYTKKFCLVNKIDWYECEWIMRLASETLLEKRIHTNATRVTILIDVLSDIFTVQKSIIPLLRRRFPCFVSIILYIEVEELDFLKTIIDPNFYFGDVYMIPKSIHTAVPLAELLLSPLQSSEKKYLHDLFVDSKTNILIVLQSTSINVLATILAHSLEIPVIFIDHHVHITDFCWKNNSNNQKILLSLVSSTLVSYPIHSMCNINSEISRDNHIALVGSLMVDNIINIKKINKSISALSNTIIAIFISGLRLPDILEPLVSLENTFLIYMFLIIQSHFDSIEWNVMDNFLQKLLSATTSSISDNNLQHNIQVHVNQSFIQEMEYLVDAKLVITDRLNIAIAASYFGVPCVLLTDDLLDCHQLPNVDAIICILYNQLQQTIENLLSNPELLVKMSIHSTVFGDGLAGHRVACVIASYMHFKVDVCNNFQYFKHTTSLAQEGGTATDRSFHRADPFQLRNLYLTGQLPDIKSFSTANNCILNDSLHKIVLKHIEVYNTSSTYKYLSEKDNKLSLQNNNKLFCGIYTTARSHEKNLLSVRTTWGKRCDGWLAFSTIENLTISTIAIDHEGEENYHNIWQKIRSVWRYIWMHFREEFDWFLLGGDDMYVIVENLRYFLESPIIVAERMKGNGMYIGRRVFRKVVYNNEYITFNHGGPGYILDKIALDFLVKNIDSRYCKAYARVSYEDILVGLCLKYMGNGLVPFASTPDNLGRERFHHLTPKNSYNAVTQFEFFENSAEGQVLGDGCCSDSSIAFQDLDEQLMQQVHSYLYYCTEDRRN